MDQRDFELQEPSHIHIGRPSRASRGTPRMPESTTEQLRLLCGVWNDPDPPKLPHADIR
jgi:hypothetical protein